MRRASIMLLMIGIFGLVAAAHPAEGATTYIACKYSVSVYNRPDVKSYEIAYVYMNTKFELIGQDKEWLHVKTGNVDGWILDSDVCKVEPPKPKKQTKRKETPIQSMHAALEKANSGGRLFESVVIKGNEAVIEVNLKWYRLPKGDRLNLAQALWKWWALTINPDNPDKAYIKIVDPNGNRVGGSGFLGSLVKVDD